MNRGEFVLNIIDVNDKNQFNASHIMDTIFLFIDELYNCVLENFKLTRDVYYVYKGVDETTAETTMELPRAYINVA